MTVIRPAPAALLGPTLGAILLFAACAPPDAGRPNRAAEGYLAIVAAEDARPVDGPELESLIRATGYADARLRRTAVRALGRLENPALAGTITHHLDDADPSVRTEAANALAQAFHRVDGTPALDALLASAGSEQDEEVLGVIARSLGRLRLTGEDQAAVVDALLDMSADGRQAVMEGVVLGLEALVRRSGERALGDRATGRLVNLLRYRSSDEQTAARVRMLALSTLRQAGALTVQYVEAALRDTYPGVRRAAASSIRLVQPAMRAELARRALADASMGVSVEAITQIAGEPRTALTCRWLISGAEQSAAQPVQVVALDALAQPCPDSPAQRQVLLDVASGLGSATDMDWLAPSRALLSLARIAPELVDALLPAFLDHGNAFVRSYGARAAALTGRTDALRALAGDPSPNVRADAIQLLAEDGTDSIDEVLIGQLSTDDAQLLMTASRLLEGSRLGFPAAAAALAAFERISVARRETSRDARRALLTRVEELGNAALADRLTPFLSDFDAQVAADVARILQGWSGGGRRQPDPQALPRAALPGPEELAELERSTVILHMQRGDSIVIEPLPYLALTNAYRFVRLASDGYFDGLTFHRWAPNFVIQGGSPGANEYSGDGPYTRDEVGLLPHWRGTVGLSTRGHDTGDGQIFINLVDNVRLDHDYTIYGVVVEGMDVVDRVVEGDVILRAEVRTGG